MLLYSYKCKIFIFLLLTTLLVIFLTVYTCTGLSCFGVSRNPQFSAQIVPSKNKLFGYKFNASVLNRIHKLDLEGSDIVVYLHIQKTGGASFGRHLVHNLDIEPPCQCLPKRKKCDCLTKNGKMWLLSRHSTGWACGLHADWTELNDCVDEWFKKNEMPPRSERRYHYITFLRNPVDRFLSEWQHVKRGATWKAVRLHCNGRDATLDEVPFCFRGSDWSGVSFDEFLSCKHNLAFNRMTRMLANLSKVNCYKRTGMSEHLVGETLLNSAKENLINLAFFGLVEEQEKTQFLFERSFGIMFIDNLKQKLGTHISQIKIDTEMKNKVIASNQLDMSLYHFAKDLFFQRVEDLEKKLGYTVQEYFAHIRDSDNNNAEINSQEEEYEDENEDTEDDEENHTYYPSKSTFISSRLREYQDHR